LVQPLGSLLDKSMIYRLPGPEPTPTRFGMLSMLRDFGHERLVGSVEHDQVFERLTSFYLDFAAEAELGIRSRAQRRWKRLIDLEVDTLRAELAWLAEHGRGDDLVTLLRALWLWYWLSGQLVEGRDWVRRTLPFEQRLAADQRAWLVCLDGLFAFFQLDLEPAAERLAQARSLFEETSDRLGFATVLAIAGFAAGAVSGEAAALEQLNEAHAAFVELDDAWGRAGTLGTICRIRSIFGRYESAGDLFEENLTAAERVGDDLLIALALTNLADYSFAVGEPAASRRYIDRALALLDATGIRYSAPDLLEALARVEGHTGAHARAAELVGAAENLRQTMHVPLWGPIAERHADVVQRLRRELGTEAFDDLRARGRTTSLSHWLQSPARKPGETAPDVKLPTDRP
jgi:non-specific serine/threonine protein kinase